jgi:hypothetical protein
LSIAGGESLNNLTIKAESKTKPGVCGEAFVNIPTVKISIDQSSVSVKKGSNVQLTAEVTALHGAPTGLNWSIEDGSGGSYLTKQSGNVSAEKTVYIPTVESVQITDYPASMLRNSTATLTAAVTAVNGATPGVDWSITTTVISNGTTINSSTRLLEIGFDETKDSITVRATSKFDNPSKYDEKTIAIPQPAITGVSVSPGAQRIKRGSSYDFTATVNGYNNHPTAVTWTKNGGGSSTTLTNATNNTVKVKVGTDEKETSFTITAKSVENSSMSASATIEIPTVNSVTIESVPGSVARNGTYALKASVNQVYASNEVKWSIDSDLSTITSTGELYIHPNEMKDTLTITATAVDDTSKSGTATIKVPAKATVNSVSVSPGTASISPGGSQQFTFTVIGDNSPDQTVTWSIYVSTSGGGTIYGTTDTDTNILSMTGTGSYYSTSGEGTAVYVSSPARKRNTTAGSGDNLDSAIPANWQ